MKILDILGRKNADTEKIAAKVIKDPEGIQDLVEGISAPKGTLRYACEKVLRRISEERPDLIYPHFDLFAEMLDHSNSFLKWGAMLTLANLTAVDGEGRFEKIFGRYYAQIQGPAMVTAANAIGGSATIASHKPKLVGKITEEILKVEKGAYERKGLPSPECRNVVIGRAIDTFDALFDGVKDRERVLKFVKRQLGNERKAVAKKAELFLKKHR